MSNYTITAIVYPNRDASKSLKIVDMESNSGMDLGNVLDTVAKLAQVSPTNTLIQLTIIRGEYTL